MVWFKEDNCGYYVDKRIADWLSVALRFGFQLTVLAVLHWVWLLFPLFLRIFYQTFDLFGEKFRSHLDNAKILTKKSHRLFFLMPQRIVLAAGTRGVPASAAIVVRRWAARGRGGRRGSLSLPSWALGPFFYVYCRRWGLDSFGSTFHLSWSGRKNSLPATRSGFNFHWMWPIRGSHAVAV